jgi:DNA repair protein RecO (recombination protein O)
MYWTDEGIILGVKAHGENSAVVTVLTLGHGLTKGYMRGAFDKRSRATVQTGNRVAVTWRSRLEDQLGNFSLEMLTCYPARVFTQAAALSALTSACEVLGTVLAERQVVPDLYERFIFLLDDLASPDWEKTYVRWELDLLKQLGYGIDLSRCALTGRTTGLAYVSPRTGRAVTELAGEPYRTKLLPLPAFLTMPSCPASCTDFIQGMRLTGYFLEQHLLNGSGRYLPRSRGLLVDLFRQIEQRRQVA